MVPPSFKVLLVNPPIVDFAAHDMWSAPLGLMRIAGALESSGIEYEVVDFLGPRYVRDVLSDGRRRYKKHPCDRPVAFDGLKIPRNYSLYGAACEGMDSALSSVSQVPDLVVITTMMTYWYPGCVEAYRAVKRHFPDAEIAVGGVYASLIPAHAGSVMPGARIFTNGNMDRFDGLVEGLSGRPFRCFSLPFNEWPKPVSGQFPGLGHIPISLVRGCPFACGYCADPLLVPRMESMDPKALAKWVIGEAGRTGVRRLALMDDAFLVDRAGYARPFMRALVESGVKFEVHAPNGLHPRWIDRETAGLMAAVSFRTIRLSLETTDPGIASASSGKVEISELSAALENLEAAGYDPGETGVYLIAGLPGQTPEDVMRSIRYVRQLGVGAYLPEFSPIPGTPLFNDALSMAVADIREPLLQNNSLLSCWHPGFPWSAVQELKDAARETRKKEPYPGKPGTPSEIER